jgi:hypothetical protein
MDMGLSDFDMSRCEHDHTFCNSEAVKQRDEFTIEEMRQYLIDQENGRTWREPEEKDKTVNGLIQMTGEEIEDKFEEDFDSSEAPSFTCPLCTMKEITDGDALAYLLLKHQTTLKDVLAEVKAKFNGNYLDFNKHINPPKP